MFRRVELPAQIPGRLLLHSMPGRYEAIENVWNQLRKEAVWPLCAYPKRLNFTKNPPNTHELSKPALFRVRCSHFEIPDRGIPEDRQAFWSLAGDIAKRCSLGKLF